MKKALIALVVIISFGVCKSDIQILEFSKVPSEKIASRVIVDFCIDGLLYRGFEANGSYMTSKVILEPASIHQVIGADGKPIICEVRK